MRIKWHYYLDYSIELMERLESWKIHVEVIPEYNDGVVFIPARLVFDIYEDAPYFRETRNLIPCIDAGIPSLCFSEKERDAAPWLAVRGTSMKLEIDEASGAFFCTGFMQDNCAHHRYRTGQPFFLRKMLKWNRRHFFCCSYDLGMNYLFCNDMARNILEGNQCDVQYEVVYHVKTRQPIPNVSFLNLKQVVPREAIRWERGATEIVCPRCGKIQIDYGSDFQLWVSETALKSMGNLFRTEAIFGGGNFLSPINIVTQELYQTLKQHGMTKNLSFTPIVPF